MLNDSNFETPTKYLGTTKELELRNLGWRFFATVAVSVTLAGMTYAMQVNVQKTEKEISSFFAKLSNRYSKSDIESILDCYYYKAAIKIPTKHTVLKITPRELISTETDNFVKIDSINFNIKNIEHKDSDVVVTTENVYIGTWKDERGEYGTKGILYPLVCRRAGTYLVSKIDGHWLIMTVDVRRPSTLTSRGKPMASLVNRPLASWLAPVKGKK